MDVREDTVEFVERVVVNHQTALAALAAQLDHDLGTEGIGQPVFERLDVRITPPRDGVAGLEPGIFRRRIDQPANQCFGFSNR